MLSLILKYEKNNEYHKLKNMKILLFITLVALLSSSAIGQTCSCESNFDWMKKTFEENDAGFQYIIDKKGEAAYNIHNQLMLEKIKEAKTSTECTKLLYEWLMFFRSEHIGIRRLTNEETTSQNILETTQKAETWEGDISLFENYIDTKQESDYEGVWTTGSYKIGIKKEGENYIGFIIESGVDTWTPGMVKLKIENDNEKIRSTFYMRNHSPIESSKPELIGENYLQIGQQLLKRLKPFFPTDPVIENYFKSLNTQSPYLEELNATTLYLRIPSFDISQKKEIDSVIWNNKERILQTKNLIIDVRDNGGGSDSSFDELIPILYTNTIRNIGVEFLSTAQNNQFFLELATKQEFKDYFDDETRAEFMGYYEKLQSKLGKFVNVFGDDIYNIHYDSINEYPKNVGIIINNGNASATEQFLYYAKQSKKVKLFGTSTYGAFDISNLYEAESPCKEFELVYGLSRSIRIPDMVIDDIGFQPDYYLDKTIPQHQWVEHVNGILSQ